MEELFEVLKELEDQGYKVVVGWQEKKRKKDMSEAMKKLKASGDENNIRYAKKLARYYGIFHNMGFILNPEISLEEDKYGLNYFCHYLKNFVDTAKIGIAGVMTALADDEKLDPFCTYLMYTHLYLVVNRATNGSNQSERSTFFFQPIRIEHMGHVTQMTRQ